MADNTLASHGGRAEKHRFTCGKQDFTISRDPATGRWSHNRVGEDSFRRLASAERAQFQIVEIVCELLTEGIVLDAACAITDGKKLWRFYNGQSPQLAQKASPALLLAYLMFQERHPSWEGLTDKQGGCFENVGYFSNYRPVIDEAKWLRGVMGTTTYWDEDQNPDVSTAVRRRVYGMSVWEAGDLELWDEYAAWTISNTSSHQAAKRLSEVLAKMVRESIRSGEHKPGWEMLWNAGSGQQPDAVRALHRLARKHYKSLAEIDTQPHYLMPHGVINAWDVFSDCATIVMAGAGAEALAESSDPIHDMPVTLLTTLRVFAWKMAFAEIIAASEKAGSLAFGCEYPSLRALCEAKYGDAVEHLFPHVAPDLLASLKQEAAAQFAADIEWKAFVGSPDDDSPLHEHVKYDIGTLKVHHRPSEKK